MVQTHNGCVHSVTPLHVSFKPTFKLQNLVNNATPALCLLIEGVLSRYDHLMRARQHRKLGRELQVREASRTNKCRIPQNSLEGEMWQLIT